MKATAKMLFDLPITSKELKQKLALLGVSTDDATYQTAVLVAMLNQAMKGNVKAAAFCRELLGEDPSLQLRRDELKLSREKFQHEKVWTSAQWPQTSRRLPWLMLSRRHTKNGSNVSRRAVRTDDRPGGNPVLRR